MKHAVKVYKKVMETEVEADSIISAKKQVEDILDKDKDLILRVSIPTDKEWRLEAAKQWAKRGRIVFLNTPQPGQTVRAMNRIIDENANK